MAKWPDDVKKYSRVSAAKLRDLYNSSGIDAIVDRGEGFEEVFSSNHPSAPLADEPFCTKSQIVKILRSADRALLATFHRYLRVDGSIGASGRRDPKAVRSGDTVYLLDDTPTSSRR